ncbi:MAG TPA: glycosyltransferase family 2 protein [Chitinophagales bacterium]|nr:glycosyltransferase family 2 protein [Chitinophagales bacterium]
MSAPAISVLMPVYNGASYLATAIDSILNQTFTDFELLLINDGSTDSSENIIHSYADPRIRYIKNETNIRLIATLNKGIELCRGKYIVRMDADDISELNRLQLQYDFMESHPGIALCGSWFKMFGEQNNIIKYTGTHDAIRMKMLYQCHFCHPSVIIRTAMIKTIEPKFDAAFIHAEDYEFFARITEKFETANIQRVLLNYRFHAGSVSTQNKSTQVSNSVIIKKRMFAKMGIDATDEDLQLYQSIEQHEYKKSIDYLMKSKLLLEKMCAANNSSGYMNKQFVQQYLGQLWFNVAYNLSALGPVALRTYKSSTLSTHINTGPMLLFKFRIKTLLKR